VRIECATHHLFSGLGPRTLRPSFSFFFLCSYPLSMSLKAQRSAAGGCLLLRLAEKWQPYISVEYIRNLLICMTEYALSMKTKEGHSHHQLIHRVVLPHQSEQREVELHIDLSVR
jgi:hypothetical protein